jgi:drug/metabolite transporter (DMT)-like permease
MRPGTVLGALLILAGVIALSVGGFSLTTRDKVADVGPIHVTTEHQRPLPVSPILGGLAIVGGVILIVASSRKAR